MDLISLFVLLERQCSDLVVIFTEIFILAINESEVELLFLLDSTWV